MKTAQDYLTDSAGGETRGGFNSRMYGDSHRKCMEGMPPGSRWGARNHGWSLADSMIREGKIFSMIDGVEFKCSPDGNAWCCVGKGFENLQESSNYTFGDTYDEAVASFMERNPND